MSLDELKTKAVAAEQAADVARRHVRDGYGALGCATESAYEELRHIADRIAAQGPTHELAGTLQKVAYLAQRAERQHAQVEGAAPIYQEARRLAAELGEGMANDLESALRVEPAHSCIAPCTYCDGEV